jgi:hypothetical protein
MPRYYFHITNTVRLADPDGTVLADNKLALAHAMRVIRELMFMRTGMLGQPWSAWTMRVSKKDGETIHTVPFTELDDNIRH